MDGKRAALRFLALIKSRAFLALIESLGALAGCLLVSGIIGVVLIFLLMPITYRADLVLVPRPGEPAPPSEIVERVERTRLVEVVEIIEDESGCRLRLAGLPSREVPPELLVVVLPESGYAVADLSVRPDLSEGRIIKKIGVPYLSLQALVFILAGGLLVRFRMVSEPRPALSGAPASVGMGVLAGLGAFLFGLLLSQTLRLLGVQVQEQPWVLELLRDRQALLRLVPWLVLIVPVSEEVFFRGYMFRWLSTRAGEPIGFAVSSVAFALMHFNWSGFVVYVAVGLIFAWLFKRTGGLLAPVVAHVVYNAIVLAVAVLLPPQL